MNTYSGTRDQSLAAGIIQKNCRDFCESRGDCVESEIPAAVAQLEKRQLTRHFGHRLH